VSPGELAAAARRAGRLALDTEFVGEGRYRTLLCVVQIAVPDGAQAHVEVLDALDPELGPEALAEVLADPDVEVVVHAGRQDVALLRRVWETDVRGVFDTQVAAGFAGLRGQASYESLLRAVLGVRLGKTASYTRWDVRPLTEEQLSYARADVAHLLALAETLQTQLASSGRLEWAREECRRLESASDERVPDELFERLPRIAGLDPRVRAVARELVSWREDTASSMDRPVNSILNDAALVEVARRRPKSRDSLAQVRGVPAATLHRRADDLVAAVARGLARPPLPAERHPRWIPADEDAPLVALAEALIRTRAQEEGLAYELLATRAELQALVSSIRENREEPPARVLEGWRRELIGDELLELLGGRRALAVGPDRKLTIEALSPRP
jgi:ribonuclease D